MNDLTTNITKRKSRSNPNLVAAELENRPRRGEQRMDVWQALGDKQ